MKRPKQKISDLESGLAMNEGESVDKKDKCSGAKKQLIKIKKIKKSENNRTCKSKPLVFEFSRLSFYDN